MGCAESSHNQQPKEEPANDGRTSTVTAANVSKYREITVANRSDIFCLIKADSVKTAVMENEYNKAFEIAQKTEVSANLEGAGVSAGAGHAKESTAAVQESGAWKVAFSGFIDAHYVQVKPHTKKTFAIEGEVAYISVFAVGKKRVAITNWQSLGHAFVFDGDDLNKKEEYEAQQREAQNPESEIALMLQKNRQNEQNAFNKKKKHVDDEQKRLKKLKKELEEERQQIDALKTALDADKAQNVFEKKQNEHVVKERETEVDKERAQLETLRTALEAEKAQFLLDKENNEKELKKDKRQIDDRRKSLERLTTEFTAEKARYLAQKEKNEKLLTKEKQEMKIEREEIATLRASLEAEQKEMVVKYGRVLTYKADFDTNGLCYAIGTNFGENVWTNPAESGLIRVKSSKSRSDSRSINCVLGRSVVRCLTGQVEGPWISIDFGKRLKIKPTQYTLRHYVSYDGFALRHWKFEGSNNGMDWVLICEHKNDASLYGKGKSHTWNISEKNNDYFSIFRIKMTKKNSGGRDWGPDWHLCCSGFEIYGHLVAQIA